MESFKRLNAPESFIRKSEKLKSILFVKKYIKNIKNKQKIKGNKLALNNKRDKKYWRNLKFEDIWSTDDNKKILSKMQFGKCGYCDSILDENAPHIDHFYPKSQISKFEGGKSIPFHPQYTGRKQTILTINGFWWLAYDWNNYVLTCSTCNGKFKKDIFPIKEKLKKNFLEKKKYTPLIFNPFNNIKQYKYFTYTQFGLIQPVKKNNIAKNTIYVYGLDRTQLSRKRKNICSEALNLIYEFIDKKSNNKPYVNELNRLIEIGHISSEFSSVIKSIFFEITGIHWDLFEKTYSIEFQYIDKKLITILDAQFLAIKLKESNNNINIQNEIISFHTNNIDFSNEIKQILGVILYESNINSPI